jgi:hypothetical protein
MPRKVFAILLWVVSVGWLVPLGLSASLAWSWLTTEVAPLIYGARPQLNSFPLLADSQRLFWVGFLWASLVIAGWSAVLIRRLLQP